MWRKRELENYFLDPEYLSMSKYVGVSESQLRKKILESCNRRLFLDVANMVIVHIREEQKSNWVETFSRISDFKNSDEAIQQLLSLPEFAERKRTVSKTVGKNFVKRTFVNLLDEVSGGALPLEFGRGNWLSSLRGKKLLPSIINQCFVVRDLKGTALQGREKLKFVAEQLVSGPLSGQPDDFAQLYELVHARIAAGERP